ncbi:IS91 family transposase [Hoeflea sp.]|uniref:IS91 family transposase n=1 Tax=Hoeflea sp. TaxID=1940281 RepID=UPI003B02E9C5
MAHTGAPASPKRPALEVADILRERADVYRQTHRLSAQQQRVIEALVNCRTAALGGFKSQCARCGAVTIQYASCRNRHCPKCQTLSQIRWVERQCADLLDIGYWHIVFTLPHELNAVAQGNPALVYKLLFKAASRTLLEFGRNPRWLGAELGITMVLHTWGQNLGQHIHVHCIVTDGGLSPDGQRWLTPARKGFLFPTAALSKVFRGKYLDFLGAAHRSGELRLKIAGDDDSHAFECLKTSLQSRDRVAYSKAPFAGARNVVAYLGRYTHKTAISNHRLVDFDGKQVRFRWRDYADGDKIKVMRLDADEFIRRFLLHVLPRGFTRLRHYGLLANRYRAQKLGICRELLHQPAPEPRQPETTQEMLLRLTGVDITVCRQCGKGTLRQILVLHPQNQTSAHTMKTGPP